MDCILQLKRLIKSILILGVLVARIMCGSTLSYNYVPYDPNFSLFICRKALLPGKSTSFEQFNGKNVFYRPNLISE